MPPFKLCVLSPLSFHGSGSLCRHGLVHTSDPSNDTYCSMLSLVLCFMHLHLVSHVVRNFFNTVGQMMHSFRPSTVMWRSLGVFVCVLGCLGYSSPGFADSSKRMSSKRSSKKHWISETLRFWQPKIRFVVHANRTFWKPKIRFVVRSNRSFWLPKLHFVGQANRSFWLPRIEKKYIPFVRKRYRFLRLHYGRSWSKRYSLAIQRLRPIWAFPPFLLHHSWKNLPPSMHRSLKQIPAPVKKAFDHYLTWSLFHVHKRLAKNKQIPGPLRKQLAALSQAMVRSRNPLLNRRVQRAFRRVRKYAADASMQSCIRAVALESTLVNAFNTGCTNYVTRALVQKLTDDELSAVLAHEIAHGDQGHAVKNMGLIAQTTGQYAFRLLAEEVEWLLTGRWGRVLDGVVRKGHLPVVLAMYGKKAPAVEMEADAGATRILLRAGLSPRALITALMKLHGHKPGSKLLKNTRNFTQSIRHYPSLYKRVQHVLKTWKNYRAH